MGSAEEWTLLKTKSEWSQMEDQTMLEEGEMILTEKEQIVSKPEEDVEEKRKRYPRRNEIEENEETRTYGLGTGSSMKAGKDLSPSLRNKPTAPSRQLSSAQVLAWLSNPWAPDAEGPAAAQHCRVGISSSH
ncbi:hypothetical protein GH733_018213 [Mirounga leonina]|nr:hypothetical protein GH733_018213 [Mirounga leonina]